jgi:hypothetical protein
MNNNKNNIFLIKKQKNYKYLTVVPMNIILLVKKEKKGIA